MKFTRNTIVEAEFGSDIFSCNIYRENGDQIGVANGDSTAEAIQIANLFAAAPDLLEALEAMMNAHSADMEFDPDIDGPGGSGNAWRLAKSAIARARGEQS